jgi:hypothetical protein
MEMRKQIEQQIIEKAMKDESFRKQLLEEPKIILERELRMRIPDSLNVKVMEEDAQTFYIVLPAKIDPETEFELTEADLEMVSGGYDYSMPETASANPEGCNGGGGFTPITN